MRIIDNIIKLNKKIKQGKIIYYTNLYKKKYAKNNWIQNQINRINTRHISKLKIKAKKKLRLRKI